MQTTSPRFEMLRAEIIKALQNESRNTDVSERILVQDDHYIGHRFRCNGYQIDWLFNNDQIIARDPYGQRLESLEMTLTSSVPQRKAA